MNRRSRGSSLGGGRGGSPMDRAADGLQEAGRALAAMYEAARQVLPEAMHRADQALHLAERGVVALERLADQADQDAGP